MSFREKRFSPLFREVVVKNRVISTIAPPSYTRVVGQLEGQQIEVLKAFKSAGGQKERWSRADWIKMAAAITRAEDALEYRLAKSRSPSGVRLAKIRRLLEVVAEN